MAYTGKLQKVDKDTPLETILSILDQDGGLIIKQPIPGIMDKANTEIGKIFDAAEFCEGRFYGNETKRIYGLIAKSEVGRTLAIEPKVLAVMKSILAPHSNGKILLNLTQGIEIHPGQREQALHRDDSMFGAHQKPHEYMMNTMWAQTPFTQANGATLIVPGSHKWSQNEGELINNISQLQPSDIACAEMDAGDVLIYLGSTVHAGGANTTDQTRRGLVFSYSVAWLRQAEPQTLTASWDLVKTMPEELIDILGYVAVEPNLGLLEGMHPKTFLRASSESVPRVHDLLTESQNELLDMYYEVMGKKAA